jgi:hypothetical protein
MIPDAFEAFFLATAGAGAAFIGLLFVAISIHPDLTFARPPTGGVPRQLLTEATLVTLANGFVLSCVALLPTLNVGWLAVVFGLWGVLWAGRIAILLDRAHRHDAVTWRHRLRVTFVSLIAVTLCATEFVLGLGLLRQPGAISVASGLALTILGLYALGMARAWILLGDPRQGWSGWLNPLEDGVDVHRTGGDPDGFPERPGAPTSPRARIDPRHSAERQEDAVPTTSRRRHHR